MPVSLTEIELLEFWNEQLCGDEVDADRADALVVVAEEFESYIRDEGLQDALTKPDRRADARRTIRMEAIRRAEQRN